MYLFRNKFVALLLVITPKSFWSMKKLSSLFSLFLLIPLFAVASEVGDRTIPAEVAQLADSLKQKFAPDKRVALFDVDYSFSGKNVMLRGVTTSAEAKTALLDGLAKKGYAVMDCLQVLPDEAGLEGKTYGIVNVSVCNLRVAPDFSSEMMTQGFDGYAGAGVAARRLVPYPDTGQLHCMGTPSRHTSRHAGRADRLEQCRENSGDFALWLCLLTAQPGIADRL